MILVLLIIIIILLLPGGVSFLARLWSAVSMLIGLAVAYALWGTAAFWVIGVFATILLGVLVFAWVFERARPRRLLGSGPSTFSASEGEGLPTPVQYKTPVVNVITGREHPPMPVTTTQEEELGQAVNARDPFAKIAAGRVVKRALPDLEELLGQPGMIELFKTNSKRVHRRPSDGPEIWHHPAGIYMAVPEIGSERLFSTIAKARDYYDRHNRRG